VNSVGSIKKTILVVTLVAATTLVAQMTPEERQIRQTYARITLASEIYAVQKALEPGKDVTKELADGRVEFRLSDFRVGNVADHLNDPYGQFVSRLNGQDHLQIGKFIFNFERNHAVTYHNVSASVQWQRGGPVAPVDWETIPLAHVVDAAHATDKSTMTRFASYTVQSTFRGETQTTRATWWWGTDRDGKPTIIVADNLNGSLSVGEWINQPIYPGVFLDDPETQKHPAVIKWLKSAAQDCSGKKRDNCYDENTGKAGISREDIERGPIILPKESPISELLRRFQINQSCKGGDCTIYNRIDKVMRLESNSVGHKTGSHVYDGDYHLTCFYAGTSGACTATCGATPGVSASFKETDASTYSGLTVFSHSIGTGGSSGNATGAGDLTCGTFYAGSVVECGMLGCTAVVTVVPTTPNGMQVNFTPDPRSVWNYGAGSTESCAAQSVAICDPTGQLKAQCLARSSSKFHYVWNPITCACELADTPIIVHLGDDKDDGRTIELTAPLAGVRFPIRPGAPAQYSWTAAESKDAFLALDFNRDGLINDGSELFGNFTPQPPVSDPNGFLALAQNDLPEYGGNGNGLIDEGDAIYQRLRLWFDHNHDGISQADELRSLEDLRVQSISLDYKDSNYIDQYGNVFRYRAKVLRKGTQGVTSFAFDVFLVSE
jgi:hypothetical protein